MFGCCVCITNLCTFSLHVVILIWWLYYTSLHDFCCFQFDNWLRVIWRHWTQKSYLFFVSGLVFSLCPFLHKQTRKCEAFTFGEHLHFQSISEKFQFFLEGSKLSISSWNGSEMFQYSYGVLKMWRNTVFEDHSSGVC